MTLFVAAADEGSRAAAGRRHCRSPAAVSRAIALLEEHAETLLLRSTRRLSLTSAGKRHIAIWRDVLSKLEEVASANENGPLYDDLSLTVMPIIEPFLREHTQMRARVLPTARMP